MSRYARATTDSCGYRIIRGVGLHDLRTDESTRKCVDLWKQTKIEFQDSKLGDLLSNPVYDLLARAMMDAGTRANEWIRYGYEGPIKVIRSSRFEGRMRRRKIDIRKRESKPPPIYRKRPPGLLEKRAELVLYQQGEIEE